MRAKPQHSDWLKSGYESVLVIPDCHFDEKDGDIVGVDHNAFNAVMMYAAAHKWDRWVQLGDLGDFNVISSHNKANLKAIEKQTVLKSAAACNAGLDCIQENVSRNGKPLEQVVLSGNHDYRLVAVTNAQPLLSGLLDFDKLMRFRERGITYVDYWGKHEIWKCGKVGFIHGIYTGSTAAARHMADYGFNVVGAHDHGVWATPVKTYGNETRISMLLGCLCEILPTWTRGKPNKWQHAFGHFYIRKEDGRFNHYVPFILDGQFIGPDGKAYDGRTVGRRSKGTTPLCRRIPKDY